MLSFVRDSLVEIATRRALEDGAGTAFSFLRDGEQDVVRLNRAELDRRARLPFEFRLGRRRAHGCCC
jgi:hypothetical protein